jgi:ABC-type glycerol-3-phosphate transport system substrate-binding protein
MQQKISFLAIILLCAAIGIAGCTGTPGTPASQPTATAAPSATPSLSSVPDLVPAPTDALPADYEVTIDVGEKDYLATIPVIFQGGKGQIHVTRIDVTFTRSDGQVKTTTIGKNKGDMIELEGTKQTDRVEVWVSMNNGQRYKTNDVLSPYRTRG